MTTLAPPTAGVGPTTTTTSGGRSGPVAWMALPALAMFIGFGVIPLVGVLALSFTTWDGIGEIHPSGLTSWRAELSDPGLPHALWVTFEVMILSWAVQTPMSILIGVFLAAHKRYRGFLAVLYFIPLLLSSAAIAITFKALLDPNFGLGPGLHIPLLTQDWLGRSGLALGVVIFVVSWQFIPFHSLIYQGAVRQIPTSMYEAAQIDGAGRVRQFFSITLPQLNLRPHLRAHRRRTRRRHPRPRAGHVQDRLPGQPDGTGERDRGHPRPGRPGTGAATAPARRRQLEREPAGGSLT